MSLAQSFAQSTFARFINSPAGRITRVIAGLLLVVWGCMHLGQSDGPIFILVGLIPLATGAFDLCLISALLGGPISGKKVRSSVPQA